MTSKSAGGGTTSTAAIPGDTSSVTQPPFAQTEDGASATANSTDATASLNLSSPGGGDHLQLSTQN
jgi:hypothetical protein